MAGVDDYGERESESLRAELAELRAENETLRRLLGTGNRPSAPTDAYRVNLFDVADPLPQVDNGSIPRDKVDLFRALFVGRNDVYAIR